MRGNNRRYRGAATNAFLGEVAKEAFDPVEPRRTGRGEVDVEAFVAGERAFDLRVFVRRVVVHDELEFLLGRGLAVDRAQELQPFLMAVLFHAGADQLAVQRVQGGKQGGQALAFEVVGDGPRPPLLERQTRLRAIQHLNLTLLIDRQHQGVFGRIQVEADNVLEFIENL